MPRNLFYLKGIAALTIFIVAAACSPSDKGNDPTPGWKMHIIDNTSFGSDGTKVADVNGDGYQDVICGWEQGHVARLYINPYPDTIWSFIELPAPDVEDALVVDLDEDGNLDIVTFSEGTHRRITFHFAPTPEEYLKSDQWTSIDVPCSINVTQWMFGRPMDVDGKHGIDIVVAAKNQGALVGWLASPADPRDVSAWKLHEIAEASWIMSVEIVDINHDGRQDVLISDRHGQTNGVKWFVHPGFGSGTLTDKWPKHLIGMEGLDPMFLDIQLRPENGLYDIWVPNLRQDIFHFTQLDSSGYRWHTENIPFPTQAGLVGKSAARGDIDLDGNLDLVTTYDGAEDRIGVMWSTFDSTDLMWRHYDVSGVEGNKYDFAYLIDLNHDGALDILTSEENNNSSTVAGLGVVWYENPFRK